MSNYHCECDPHGDNAKCDRPCCKPPQASIQTPASKDLEEAVDVLRHVAWQTRSRTLADTLKRVADWLEGKIR